MKNTNDKVQIKLQRQTSINNNVRQQIQRTEHDKTIVQGLYCQRLDLEINSVHDYLFLLS